MQALRAFLRTFKLIGYFTRYGLELIFRRPATRQARADWLHRFCAAALRGFDVQLTVNGSFPQRGALISNHLSYLDIIVFAALSPCVFCSKAEIKHWPILGWMTTMAGTVFVERGRGGSALRAGAEMKDAAQARLPVVFFPEGTTSNGQQLLSFHSGLLAQALAAEEPITPAHIHYTLDAGNGPHISVADDVCYWGEVNMLKHIVRFLGLRGVHAHVHIAPAPIAFHATLKNRKGAAAEARQSVLALAPAPPVLADHP
jgi:1-acyl-sn-glycerol-3-phosphate acyltransferase